MPKVPNSSHLMYLGIDPGKYGGIAGVVEGEVLVSHPMPETEKDIWDVINLTGLHNMPRMAVIEQISPGFPGTAKSSMSKLYGSYMALRMALTAAGISYEVVAPSRWQKGLQVQPRRETDTDSQWKNRLKAKAQQLFLRAKITPETADAVLIAEYCRRKNLGLLL